MGNIVIPEEFNQYSEMKVIGKGGYGKVIRCYDNVLNKTYYYFYISVIIKCVNDAKKLWGNALSVTREIMIMKCSNHPNIPKLMYFYNIYK